MDIVQIQKRAQAKLCGIEQARQDPRFVRVVGKLQYVGLIETNLKHIGYYAGKILLDDVLWAGATEPRILELVPALVLKTPGIFRRPLTLPTDLRDVVKAIRKNTALGEFRGVAAEQYMRWVAQVGHRGKVPSLLKSYRFSSKDLTLLRTLQLRLGSSSEIDALRFALNMANTP